MGSGEEVRLDRDHVDWDDSVVTVWNSKFRKSRAQPEHPSTLTALERYGQFHDDQRP